MLTLQYCSIEERQTLLLQCLQIRPVLLQGLSEKRLEEAAQTHLQVPERW
jgi:hypothetical protein